MSASTPPKDTPNPLVTHKLNGKYLHPVAEPCMYCRALADGKARRIIAGYHLADGLAWRA